MRHPASPFVFVAAVALASCGGQNKPAPPPTPEPVAVQLGPAVESIKVVMDGTATTDGEVRLEFTPAGGETKTIRVSVLATIPADEVVRDLAKAIKAAIAPDYLVDRYDPFKIKISFNKKSAPFRLSLVALTAKGLTIRLE